MEPTRRSFTFWGYMFRPWKAYNKRTGEVFTGFLPAVSPEKLTMMSRRVASWRLHRRTTLDLNDLAAGVNLCRGAGRLLHRVLPDRGDPRCQRIDRHLMRWARWKYKRLQRSGREVGMSMVSGPIRAPEMFVHWRYCSAPS